MCPKEDEAPQNSLPSVLHASAILRANPQSAKRCLSFFFKSIANCVACHSRESRGAHAAEAIHVINT